MSQADHADNPVVVYWIHDALSNSERMLTDYTPAAITLADRPPSTLIIAEREDGTREIADPATITDPAVANTRTGTSTPPIPAKGDAS